MFDLDEYRSGAMLLLNTKPHVHSYFGSGNVEFPGLFALVDLVDGMFLEVLIYY